MLIFYIKFGRKCKIYYVRFTISTLVHSYDFGYITKALNIFSNDNLTSCNYSIFCNILMSRILILIDVRQIISPANIYKLFQYRLFIVT